MFRLNNIRIAFYLAYKQVVRGNKGTLILTIGIMSLVFLNIAFMGAFLGGAENGTLNQMIDNQTSHIRIDPKNDETFIKDVNAILGKIDSHHAVVGSVSHYKTSGAFTYDKYKNQSDLKDGNWSIMATSPTKEKTVSSLSEAMVSGEFLTEKDRDQIIIGKNISGNFGSSFVHDSLGGKNGIPIGSTLLVKYPNGIEREYTVKGIFNLDDMTMDHMAFVTTKEIENVLGFNNMASEILVKTNDLTKAPDLVSEFHTLGIKDVQIRSWKDFLGKVETITASFSIIDNLFGGIGLAVSAVTIFIIIFIRVVDKRKEIGILKAIGMQKNTIVLSYIFQVIFYALLGIGGGLLLLYFFLAKYFERNPIPMPVGDVTLFIVADDIIFKGVALIIAAILSGFLPAWQTSKKSILDLIWGQ